jgi:hypothetical protein
MFLMAFLLYYLGKEKNKMTTQTNLPTKTQIDGLIATCLKAELNEAAGLLTLASAEISKFVSDNTDEPQCVCLEVIGDNGTCPVHGKGFEEAKAEYYSDYGAEYQERNDLYSFAIGR